MMFTYDVLNELKVLKIIYDYLHQDFLTNPECSLISGQTLFSNSKTFGQDHDQMPTDYETFRRILNMTTWDSCLCVAGSNKSDTHRVVLTYSRDLKKVIINFPSSANNLSENEKRIKEWLNLAFKNIL